MSLVLTLPPGDVSTAVLNDRMQRIQLAIETLQGLHGTIAIAAEIDMRGNKITGLGAATSGPDALSQAAGDRRYLGAIAVVKAAQATSSATTPATAAAAAAKSTGQLEFTAPGTLGIAANVAPLVSLPAAATPTSLVALVKQAPSGAALTVSINVGGSVWGQVVVKDGATSATVTTGLSAIAANAVVTVDLLTVGTTFPGSDLTLLIRFG